MIKLWYHSIRARRFVCLLFLIEFARSNAFVATIQVYPYRAGTDASIFPRNFLFLHRSRKRLMSRSTQMMVRNIDLPEAIVLYGTSMIIPSFGANKSDLDASRRFFDAHQDNVVDSLVLRVRKGLEKFLEECHAINTVVVLLLDQRNEDLVFLSSEHISYQNDFLEKMLATKAFKRCRVFVQTVSPPNPTDLVTIANHISVQPRPYGGSATIGYSRAADPERLLDPKHCVVFTSTINQTRVARALGMRVISINANDDLADAVLMDYDDNDSEHISMHISVDDIATPGSFWLNPPHPRDDYGNRVDDPFETLLHSPNAFIANQDISTNQSDIDVDYDDDDSKFQAMLNDIAPLYDYE